MKKIALLSLLFVSFLTKADVAFRKSPIEVYVREMPENLDKNKPLTLQEAFNNCVCFNNLNRRLRFNSQGEHEPFMTREEVNVCEKIFSIMQEKLQQFVEANATNNTK